MGTLSLSARMRGGGGRGGAPTSLQGEVAAARPRAKSREVPGGDLLCVLPRSSSFGCSSPPSLITPGAFVADPAATDAVNQSATAETAAAVAGDAMQRQTTYKASDDAAQRRHKGEQHRITSELYDAVVAAAGMTSEYAPAHAVLEVRLRTRDTAEAGVPPPRPPPSNPRPRPRALFLCCGKRRRAPPIYAAVCRSQTSAQGIGSVACAFGACVLELARGPRARVTVSACEAVSGAGR